MGTPFFLALLSHIFSFAQYLFYDLISHCGAATPAHDHNA
jgi:zona occludens toxin (predicted ATPase)